MADDTPDYGLSQEERDRFDDAFDAHTRGELSLTEAVEQAFPETSESTPAEPGDRVDATSCAECGEEHDDLRLQPVAEEYEVIVSRGRQHPQTGEYMNVETRREVDGHLMPLCPSCRTAQ